MDNYTYTRDQEKKVEKTCVKELYIALLKEQKNLVFWRENRLSKHVLALLRKIEKKTKSFGGKIVLRKKGCTLEWSLALSQKYTKSFGGKNLALCKTILPHQKLYYIFISSYSVQKRRSFFFSANLHWQKKVKEIAYILTSYPDVKSAF